ncbi:MAG: hypothetical protein WCL29_02305, partial [Pseudomonadota bacterium]
MTFFARHVPSTPPALALCFVVLISLGGCYREVSDATPMQQHVVANLNAPWSIDGVKLGQTLDEIRSRHGDPQPNQNARPGQNITYMWSRGDELSVTFDTAGHAIEMYGNALYVGTEQVIRFGMPENEVVIVLGKGVVSYANTPGSFVISIGGKFTGGTM